MTAINVTLEGGLCNKLFSLFSACDIAIKNKTKIIEPTFGWKRKILFSDIYDISFFNEAMKEFNNGEELIVSQSAKSNYKIIQNKQNLWQYSETILKTQRKTNQIKEDCIMIVVLKALKLNERNLQICNSVLNIENKCAMHIRIEQDWLNYSTKKMKSANFNELYLINTNSLIDLYKNKGFEEEVFFTTGENQTQVQKQMLDKDIKSDFIFVNDLEYEVNAAINFELCCRAKLFVGLTRSTFSNLISLKRALADKNNSYIYNLDEQLYVRVDKGLHPCPKNAIHNHVEIV